MPTATLHRSILLSLSLTLLGACESNEGSSNPRAMPFPGHPAATGGMSAVSDEGGGLASGGSSDQSPDTGGNGALPPETPATSAELIASLRLGWNLGNSLDAPEGETAWGNPQVSAELLKSVAAGGFDLVRIPVTWSLHTGPGPDYLIDPAWMTRVKEVVEYAEAAGLYAIINLHHDGADGYDGVEWLSLNDSAGLVTEQNNAEVKARFLALWTQIATAFAANSHRVLFESMNEIHDGYGAPDPIYFEIINELNQAFVQTVRASGGNNSNRHLVVPGYNTNLDHTISGFKLPSDSVENRLILSVHYYDPYLFALEATTNTWGSAFATSDAWGQEADVVQQFDRLKAEYIDRGLPVIFGEYGAVHQAGFEDYRRYYMEYVTKAAKDRGILPVYWDNGSEQSGKEALGLFNRLTGTELHPLILEAMRRAATSDYALSDVAPPN